VWAFLVKQSQLVKHHVNYEGLEAGEFGNLESTCSTAVPPSPSPQGQMLPDISRPSSAALKVNNSSLGKTGKEQTSDQNSSCKHHKVNKHESHAHVHHHGKKVAHEHSGPAEKVWMLDDDCGDFSDENLLTLFEFYANHKDFSDRKLMAMDEWHKFFRIFEEHFEGISPDIQKLSDVFTKNLNLQLDMHFAYGMEKGEASRGLTFANFKIALHEAVGHYWHKADMQDTWNDTMHRQSHGIVHGMA